MMTPTLMKTFDPKQPSLLDRRRPFMAHLNTEGL